MSGKNALQEKGSKLRSIAPACPLHCFSGLLVILEPRLRHGFKLGKFVALAQHRSERRRLAHRLGDFGHQSGKRFTEVAAPRKTS
jgi:hypothetical protein